MNRIDHLAKKFGDQISLPWQQHLSSAEKTIMIVYPKEDERRLRATRGLFEQACRSGGHAWHELVLDDLFPMWMASQDYAGDYFAYPEDIRQKLEDDFTGFVATEIGNAMAGMDEDSVLAIFGVGTLFGLTHVSSVVKRLDGRVRGRLVLFFPGGYEQNTYRLLDARDGWGYMALPITLTETLV